MTFNFTKEYKTSDNSPLPEGWYEVLIEKAYYKISKAGDEYLNLQFSTLNNRKIFGIYNVFNKSDDSRNIAMANLKDILIAQGTDVKKLESVSKDDLLSLLTSGGSLMIAVSIVTDSYGEKNKIKKYKAVEETKVKVKGKTSNPF